MSRVYNFSAGPATLPESVLQQAQEEMLDWQGAGMSVMEMSHRGKHFMSIADHTETDLRELLGVPDNYRVLFLQGGASAQFSLIPMNHPDRFVYQLILELSSILHILITNHTNTIS